MNNKKPQYVLNNRMKSNYFSLRIYDIIEEIRKRSNKWFTDTFSEDRTLPVDIFEDNLIDSLEYLFAEGYWIVDTAIDQGLDVSNSADYLYELYEKFTSDEKGYQKLVTDEYYDYQGNRRFTDKEVQENREYVNKVAIDVIRKIKNKNS